jgi:2-iminobutanoate/2-iminopropanoate deaminase
MKKLIPLLALFLFASIAFAQPKPSSRTRSAVSTTDAPKALGPYSQAIRVGDFVFCAGQTGRDPATGQLIQGDVAAQTDRVLKNVAAVLAAAGTDLDHAVKTTVYLKNIADFNAMNEVYGRFFKGTPPARSTVGVADLPAGAAVEIEVVAVLPEK